jgi:hypothetical protein
MKPTQATNKLQLCSVLDQEQGCQMAFFQAKHPNLGKFWMVLQWKMLVFFMDIWSILRPFGIPIVWPFGTLWGNSYIFPRVGKLYQEKSGNPEQELNFLGEVLPTQRKRLQSTFQRRQL